MYIINKVTMRSNRALFFFLEKKVIRKIIFSLLSQFFKKKTVTSTYSNYLWFYKYFCTFKYPLINFFNNNFYYSITFFIKKFKNYLKFSILPITKIAHYQWDFLYKKNFNFFMNNFFLLNKDVNSSFSTYVFIKVTNVIFFNFLCIKKLKKNDVNCFKRINFVNNKFNFVKNNVNFYKKNYMSYSKKSDYCYDDIMVKQKNKDGIFFLKNNSFRIFSNKYNMLKLSSDNNIDIKEEKKPLINKKVRYIKKPLANANPTVTKKIQNRLLIKSINKKILIYLKNLKKSQLSILKFKFFKASDSINNKYKKPINVSLNQKRFNWFQKIIILLKHENNWWHWRKRDNLILSELFFRFKSESFVDIEKTLPIIFDSFLCNISLYILNLLKDGLNYFLYIRKFNFFFKFINYDNFDLPFLKSPNDKLMCIDYLNFLKTRQSIFFLKKHEQFEMNFFQFFNKPSKLINLKRVRNLKFLKSKLFFFEPYNLITKKKISSDFKTYIKKVTDKTQLRMYSFFKKKKYVTYNYLYFRDFFLNNYLDSNDVSDDEIDDILEQKIKNNEIFELPKLKKCIYINTTFSDFKITKNKKLRYQNLKNSFLWSPYSEKSVDALIKKIDEFDIAFCNDDDTSFFLEHNYDNYTVLFKVLPDILKIKFKLSFIFKYNFIKYFSLKFINNTFSSINYKFLNFIINNFNIPNTVYLKNFCFFSLSSNDFFNFKNTNDFLTNILYKYCKNPIIFNLKFNVNKILYFISKNKYDTVMSDFSNVSILDYEKFNILNFKKNALKVKNTYQSKFFYFNLIKKLIFNNKFFKNTPFLIQNSFYSNVGFSNISLKYIKNTSEELYFILTQKQIPLLKKKKTRRLMRSTLLKLLQIQCKQQGLSIPYRLKRKRRYIKNWRTILKINFKNIKTKSLFNFLIFNYSKGNLFFKKLIFFQHLISKIPNFVLPQPLNLKYYIDLNPFLFDLYNNYAHDTFSIPSNLSIFNIFFNPILLENFINYNSQKLFKKILKINSKVISSNNIININELCLHYKKILLKLNFNNDKVLLISILFRNIIFNVNLIWLIRNRFKYSLDYVIKKFFINIDDLIIDCSSRIIFKNYNFKKLIFEIINYKLYNFSNSKFFFKNNKKILNSISNIYENFFYNLLNKSNFFSNIFILKKNNFFKIRSFDQINDNFIINFFKSLSVFFKFNKFNKLKPHYYKFLKKKKFNYDLVSKVVSKIKKSNNNLKKSNKKINLSGLKIIKFYKKLSLMYKNVHPLNKNQNNPNSQLTFNYYKNFSNSLKYKFNKFSNVNPFFFNFKKKTWNFKNFKSLIFFEKTVSSDFFYNKLGLFFNFINKLFKKNLNFFKNLNKKYKDAIFDLLILYLFLRLKKLYFLNKISLNVVIDFLNNKKFFYYLNKSAEGKTLLYKYIINSKLSFILSTDFFYIFYKNIKYFYNFEIINEMSFNFFNKFTIIVNKKKHSLFFIKRLGGKFLKKKTIFFKVLVYENTFKLFNFVLFSLVNYSYFKYSFYFENMDKMNLTFNSYYRFLNYFYNVFKDIKFINYFFNFSNIFFKLNRNNSLFSFFFSFNKDNFLPLSNNKIWNFSFIFLIKIGFLNFISKTSSFLNSLNFLITKNRLNTYFIKFWNDRGFFFPIEFSLYKFFFIYYTNFFFNFFETSSFLNFNFFFSNFNQEKSNINNFLYKYSPLNKRSKLSYVKAIPKEKKFIFDKNFNTVYSFNKFKVFKNNVTTFLVEKKKLRSFVKLLPLRFIQILNDYERIRAEREERQPKLRWLNLNIWKTPLFALKLYKRKISKKRYFFMNKILSNNLVPVLLNKKMFNGLKLLLLNNFFIWKTKNLKLFFSSKKLISKRYKRTYSLRLKFKKSKKFIINAISLFFKKLKYKKNLILKKKKLNYFLQIEKTRFGWLNKFYKFKSNYVWRSKRSRPFFRSRRIKKARYFKKFIQLFLLQNYINKKNFFNRNFFNYKNYKSLKSFIKKTKLFSFFNNRQALHNNYLFFFNNNFSNADYFFRLKTRVEFIESKKERQDLINFKNDLNYFKKSKILILDDCNLEDIELPKIPHLTNYLHVYNTDSTIFDEFSLTSIIKNSKFYFLKKKYKNKIFLKNLIFIFKYVFNKLKKKNIINKEKNLFFKFLKLKLRKNNEKKLNNFFNLSNKLLVKDFKANNFSFLKIFNTKYYRFFKNKKLMHKRRLSYLMLIKNSLPDMFDIILEKYKESRPKGEIKDESILDYDIYSILNNNKIDSGYVFNTDNVFFKDSIFKEYNLKKNTKLREIGSEILTKKQILEEIEEAEKKKKLNNVNEKKNETTFIEKGYMVPFNVSEIVYKNYKNKPKLDENGVVPIKFKQIWESFIEKKRKLRGYELPKFRMSLPFKLNTILLKQKKLRKSKTKIITKKTLLYFFSKSRYGTKLSSKQGLTFFSNNHTKIDNLNLFNYSKLYLKFSNNFKKFNVQNSFFKNKISSCFSSINYENYTYRSQLTKKRNQIFKVNHIANKPNILFKMKPGYLVLWRAYRHEFRLLNNLTFFRQRRLTNYFLNFKRSNSLMLLRNFEFSIFSIIKRSSFFLDYTLSYVCFNLGMVYLNGKRIFDKFVQVYVGDMVQISLTYTYLIQYKWFFFYMNYRRVSFLNKYVKHFFNIKNNSLTARKILLNFSSRLFKKILFYGNDIPNYLEVDFLTMISTVIYEPFLFYEFDPVLIYRLPFLSIRLYNWKYIN